MSYRRFSENPEYKKSSSTESDNLIADGDIIPFTHSPNDVSNEDGKITISELKGEFTDALHEQVDKIDADFIKTVVVQSAPSDIGSMEERTLYLYKPNSANDIYQGFYLIKGSDGAKEIGQIGGRIYTSGGAGLAINDATGVITNTLATQGGTISGGLSVKGNLEVTGTVTKASEVSTKNNFIILREGATAALPDNAFTGIEAEKYDGKNIGQLVFDNSGTARVGDKGATQPLSTRSEESAMTDGAVVTWSKTGRKIIAEATTIGGANTPVYMNKGVITAAPNVMTTDTEQTVAGKKTLESPVLKTPSVEGDMAVTGAVAATNGFKGNLSGNAATATNATNHIADKANPHSVTKAQVGLGSVVNTGDSATPVSGGTAKFTTGGAYTELAKKLDTAGGTVSGDLTVSGKLTADKSVDISNAAFDSPISVSQGGTGKTTAGDAFTSLASGASAIDADATDSTGFLTTASSTMEISETYPVYKRSAAHIWNWIKGKIGSVFGLSSTKTDNAVARWDGTDGALQDSGVIIDDLSNITAAGKVTAPNGFVGPLTGNATSATNATNASWLKDTAHSWEATELYNELRYTGTSPRNKTATKVYASAVADSAGKVGSKLSIKLNSETAAEFDGSAAKEIDITPSAIGAAASGHTHTLTPSTASIGSASGWSAGSLPVLGEAISADDITSWNAGSATSLSYSKGILTITAGSKPSLGYASRSIPNVTSVGSLPSLTVTGKNVMTGVSIS